jgi:hypothetical protein
MDRRTVPALLAAALIVTACGGGTTSGRTASTAASGDDAPARPALAQAPKRAGEILLQGPASPASHGPVTLDGRYTVRFEQIAPEDPNLDFTGQTAFVAVLDRHTQQEDTGTKRLFRTAARTGRTEVTARGRYWIDVEFGDFPYAIRLTPTGRR